MGSLHTLAKSLHKSEHAASAAYKTEQRISSIHRSGLPYHADMAESFAGEGGQLFDTAMLAYAGDPGGEFTAEIIDDVAAALEDMIEALWEMCENAIAAAWGEAENSFNNGQDSIYNDHIEDAIRSWEDMAGESWPEVDFGEYVDTVESCFDPEVWQRAFSETTMDPLHECRAYQNEALRLQAMLDALQALDEVDKHFDSHLDGNPSFEDFSDEFAEDEALVEEEEYKLGQDRLNAAQDAEEAAGDAADEAAYAREAFAEERARWGEEGAAEEGATEEEILANVERGAVEELGADVWLGAELGGFEVGGIFEAAVIL